jgi:FKBP-type peptidyl-prolyl cis-trans isomerase FkpA
VKYPLYLIAVFVCLISCSKDLSPAEQFEEDTKLIEEYLLANNKKAQKTPEGVYYIVEKEGSAEKPKLTSTVTVGYKGYYLDGGTFDSNAKTSFPLYGVVAGWQIGIPKFGKGGKGVLLIPSAYGYGPKGNQNIGPNTVLIFDIEVFDF